MSILQLILLILAAVLFGIAAFGPATRINLVAAGLCVWVVAVILGGVGDVNLE